MNTEHEGYIRRCYELAVSAGKKGFDAFGAVLVHRGQKPPVFFVCVGC